MKLVEFTDASNGRPIWVNPEHVQAVSYSPSGAMLTMRETVVLVKETVTSVVYRLSLGDES